MLPDRLKRMVEKEASSTQNAFTKGRQILDTALITNEVIDCLLRKKESGLLCRLDIDKAYDLLD